MQYRYHLSSEFFYIPGLDFASILQELDYLNRKLDSLIVWLIARVNTLMRSKEFINDMSGGDGNVRANNYRGTKRRRLLAIHAHKHYRKSVIGLLKPVWLKLVDQGMGFITRP
jgi:hypothetical protein